MKNEMAFPFQKQLEQQQQRKYQREERNKRNKKEYHPNYSLALSVPPADLLTQFDSALQRFSLLILSSDEAKNLRHTENKDVTRLFNPLSFQYQLKILTSVFFCLCDDENKRSTVKENVNRLALSFRKEALPHYALTPSSKRNLLVSYKYTKIMNQHYETLASLLNTFEATIHLPGEGSETSQNAARKITEKLNHLKKKITDYQPIHFKLNQDNQNNTLSIPRHKLIQSDNLLSMLFTVDPSPTGNKGTHVYDLSSLENSAPKNTFFKKISADEIKTLALFFEETPEHFFALPQIKAHISSLNLNNKTPSLEEEDNFSLEAKDNLREADCSLFLLLKNLKYFADSNYSKTLLLFLQALKEGNSTAYNQLTKTIKEENEEEFALLFQANSGPTALTHLLLLDFKEKFEHLLHAPLVRELKEITRSYLKLLNHRENGPEQTQEIEKYYSDALKKNYLPLITTGFHCPKNRDQITLETAEQEINQYFAAYRAAVIQFGHRAPLVIKGTHSTFLIEYSKDSAQWYCYSSGTLLISSHFFSIRHYLNRLKQLDRSLEVQHGWNETLIYQSINPFLMLTRPFVAIGEENTVPAQSKNHQRNTQHFLELWKTELVKNGLNPKRLRHNNAFILELERFLSNLAHLRKQKENSEREKAYKDLILSAEHYLTLVNDPRRTYVLNATAHIKRLATLNRVIETVLIGNKSLHQKENAMNQTQELFTPVKFPSALQRNLYHSLYYSIYIAAGLLLVIVPILLLVLPLLFFAATGTFGLFLGPSLSILSITYTQPIVSRFVKKVAGRKSRSNRDPYTQYTAHSCLNKMFNQIKQLHKIKHSNNLTLCCKKRFLKQEINSEQRTLDLIHDEETHPQQALI